MKSFFLICDLVLSVFWCVATGNVHEVRQSSVPSFDMFPHNIFGSVRLSLYTSAHICAVSLTICSNAAHHCSADCTSETCAFIRLYTSQLEQVIRQEASDEYPTQTGGAYSVGESSVSSGSATQISCIFRWGRPYYSKCVSAFPVMLFQQVGTAGISLIMVFKAQGFSKVREDEMTFVWINFRSQCELKVADPRKLLMSVRIPVRKEEAARAEGPRCSCVCCNRGKLKRMDATEITEACACAHLSDLAFIIIWMFLQVGISLCADWFKWMVAELLCSSCRPVTSSLVLVFMPSCPGEETPWNNRVNNRKSKLLLMARAGLCWSCSLHIQQWWRNAQRAPKCGH